MDNIIELNNLKKLYKKNIAIDGVNLEVKPNQIYGFVGPNGAGKSTTIKIMLDLIRSDEGVAKIFNLDCKNDTEIIKRDLGFVSSDVRFYNFMSVKDIINKTLKFYNLKYYDDIDKMIEYLQIDTSKKLTELSLGNKKKIAIVCALIHHPKLIILDEPTSGLDPLIQKRLFVLLQEAVKKGSTVFLSSHNLQEVETYCDNVAFIKDGKIIRVQNLKEKGIKHTKDVYLTGKIDKEDLNNIDIKLIENDENHLHFHYQGDSQDLIKAISNLNIIDIQIRNLSLEEEFMHYYEGKDHE
ncbi:MAG: ABC transporter ATP-binding protein [Thomasclavelia sp.]|nr:ABC transporter ATP-binding protein [Thomasclavelia sp.]